MIAHHITCACKCALWCITTAFIFTLRLRHEAVHLTAINISYCIGLAMRPANIFVICIMIRLDALSACGVWVTDRWQTIFHRNSVCPWEGSKVTIKGTILLHDDHDVFDFVDATAGDILATMSLVDTPAAKANNAGNDN